MERVRNAKTVCKCMGMLQIVEEHHSSTILITQGTVHETLSGLHCPRSGPVQVQTGSDLLKDIFYL